MLLAPRSKLVFCNTRAVLVPCPQNIAAQIEVREAFGQHGSLLLAPSCHLCLATAHNSALVPACQGLYYSKTEELALRAQEPFHVLPLAQLCEQVELVARWVVAAQRRVLSCGGPSPSAEDHA